MDTQTRKGICLIPYIRLGLIAVLLVTSLVFAGCAQTAQTTQVQQTSQVPVESKAAPEETKAPAGSGVVKIGVLAPLTGTSAADGEEMVRGVKLAVKELNAKGGVAGYTFDVVTGDTKDQTPDARSEERRV